MTTRPKRGWSSSSVKAALRWCPHALTLADEGAPRDTSIFDVGTVAHAILEDFHAESRTTRGAIITRDRARTIAYAVGAHMATEGRSFDGVPEAPVTPTAIHEGAQIALGWLARCEGYLDPAALPEMALAVDRDWRPCDYRDPDAHWRAVIDTAGIVNDEDEGCVIWTRDYKTAWPTSEAELETIQIRGQSLLLLAHAERLGFPHPDTLAREVVNLRTGRIFTAAVNIEQEAAMLDDWRAEIAALVKAVTAKKRTPRPGAGCAACPYRLVCTHAPPEAVDIVSTAERYLALQAEADSLKAVLKEATRETPLTLSTGQVLGWRTQTKNKPAPRAHEDLTRMFDPDASGAVIGLMKRVIGVAGIQNAARALHKRDTAKQAEVCGQLLTTTQTATWGVSDAEGDDNA